jgi:hypothetical protein
MLEWMMGFPEGWTEVESKGVEAVSETIGKYKVHPAAALFPLLEGEEFEELVESIRTNGQRHPIIIDGDTLIDGRNRLRAIEVLRQRGETIQPKIEQWAGRFVSITEWVYDTNFLRRHMTEDARVAVSASFCKLIQAENQERKKAAQFSGAKAGPGRGKKTAESNSPPPFKRDTKEKDARSTVGQVAAKAQSTIHKAKQAVALNKAVEAGIVPAAVQQEVIAGKRKLKDAAKLIPGKRNSAGEKEKLVQLSLDGKWLSLASEWLEEHCPCSEEDYFVAVTSLMPTHINAFRSKADSKMSAAKAALNKLVREKRIEISNGQISIARIADKMSTKLAPQSASPLNTEHDAESEQVEQVSVKDACAAARRCKSITPEYLAKRTGIDRTKIENWMELSEDFVGQVGKRQADGTWQLTKVFVLSDAQLERRTKSVSILGDQSPTESFSTSVYEIANRLQAIQDTFGDQGRYSAMWEKLSAEDKQSLRFVLKMTQAKLGEILPKVLKRLTEDVQPAGSG